MYHYTVHSTQYTVFTLLTSYKEAAANTDSAHCLPGGWKLANKLPLRSAWGQGLRGGECVTSAVCTPGNYVHLQPTTRYNIDNEHQSAILLTSCPLRTK